MTDVIQPVDMDECAREPIHIPGSIQPYGALLVIAPDSGHIVQASRTAAAMLGVGQGTVIGQHWEALLDLGTRKLPTLETLAKQAAHLPHAPVRFLRRALPPEQAYVAAWHLTASQWLVEIEPRDSMASDVTVRDALPVLRVLERDSSIAEASLRVALEIHAALGYDRVMVYRFDNHWNGDVIAEAKRSSLEGYLGLHYPATDIPAQARALYLRNRVRQIADMGYAPSPIEPPLSSNGAPVDLSDVTLRSVSPVHVEYLNNMGVSATLVTSIVVNDALWGLIACHHYQPLFASHSMRDVADTLTRGLSARIGALLAVERARTEAILLTVREKLITAFNEADAMTSEMLAEMAPDLMDVVDADGVAIFQGDEVTRYGQLPTPEELNRIRRQIESRDYQSLREGAVGALHTDAIGVDFPELADLAPSAAGLVFVPLMPQARSALLWTRREQVETVNWAGNPQLAKLLDIPNSRLSPRKSFDLWQETVSGKSRPWSPPHLESARSLRVLIELMERKRYQKDSSMLEASLARLRQGVAIIEQGPVGVARLVFVNDAFARQANSDTSDMFGRDMRELLDPTVPPAQLALLESQLQDGTPAGMVLPLRNADADPVFWQFDFEPLPARGGPFLHWLLQLREPD